MIMTESEYYTALSELEQIESKVSDPSTPLKDVDALLKRSAELIAGCRTFLRTVRESVESLD